MKLKNCIYRFLNNKGQVIYIGKAKDLKARMANHNHLSDECYEETVKIEYCEFGTEDDIDLAERYLIPKYKPKYNTEFKQRELGMVIYSLENLNWKIYTDKNEASINVCEYVVDNNEIKRLSEEITELKISIDVMSEMLLEFSEDVQMKENLSKKINKVSKELKGKQLEKAKKVLGEKINKYSKQDIETFIKYDIYDFQKIGQYHYDKIVKDRVEKCCKEIEQKGYYSLSELSLDIAHEINYGFGNTDKWVSWYLGCSNDEDVKKMRITLVNTVEKILEQKYGSFERLIKETNNNGLAGWFFVEKKYTIPTAEVVKKII